MDSSQKTFRKLFLLVILMLLIVCTTSDTQTMSTKGKVIQIDPNSLQYLANTFDQVLVFFLQDRNDEYEALYSEFVTNINQTYPEDHTLYAVTYFKKDTAGKLAKFNNKSDGFRIITRRNHYQMEFNNQIRQFQLLKKFYTHHVHPVMPILIPEQFSSIETEYFVVFEYNTSQQLKQYVKLYSKLYDFLKLFNVRGVALESSNNRTNVHIYNRQDPQKPIATYANELNNTDQLIDFINVETLPLLAKLDDENYVRIFGSFLDTQMILIYDQKDQNKPQVQQARQQLEQAAKYNRNEELKYQRILFAEADTQFLSKYFDESIREMQNDKNQAVTFKIVLTKTDYDHFQLRRFNYDVQEYGKPTNESLIRFMEDVRMKKVESELMSEKIPTQQQQKNSTLRKIVGKSFISEIYQKAHTSVIVLFIDSKDPESYKDIKEAFENFTTKYKSALEGKVVCSIFDLAKNQHKFLSIRTAPMLSLFERTNKKSPKNFKGYPKVETIKNWVNYEIKDFTIPENFGEEVLPLGASPSSSEIEQNTIKPSLQL